MQDLNDLWLRGNAAQHSVLQLMTYNTAVMGTATLQAMQLGLSAPQIFWSTLAQATPQKD